MMMKRKHSKKEPVSAARGPSRVDAKRRHQKQRPPLFFAEYNLLLLLQQQLRRITKSRNHNRSKLPLEESLVPLPIAFSTRHRTRIVRRISSASARVPATRPVFEVVARCWCCWWWWWSCHLLHSSRTSSLFARARVNKTFLKSNRLECGEVVIEFFRPVNKTP